MLQDARLRKIGPGTTPIMDMGAYEFQTATLLLGDMNCDGVVSVADIGLFVLTLTDPTGYAAQFPECDIQNADINGDGVASVADIGGFVASLLSDA